MNKKKIDPESDAALQVVEMERLQDALKEISNKKQGAIIARVFETAGKIKSTHLQKTQADFFTLLLLKEAKESGLYKDLGMTWEGYCNYLGLKRRTVDEHLQDLEPFRVEFLAAFRQFSGSEISKIKYLGRAISGGAAEIKDGAIHYDGEVIPIDAEHKDDIEALLSNLADAAGEAEAKAKAQKRITTHKQKHIDKIEKALAKFEGRAAERGLTPEEDAFLTQMENLRIGFDGYMFGVEPERMEDLGEDATALMRAEYLTTLWHMRARMKAAYDTGVEMFGADLIEDDERWSPQRKKKQ